MKFIKSVIRILCFPIELILSAITLFDAGGTGPEWVWLFDAVDSCKKGIAALGVVVLMWGSIIVVGFLGFRFLDIEWAIVIVLLAIVVFFWVAIFFERIAFRRVSPTAQISLCGMKFSKFTKNFNNSDSYNLTIDYMGTEYQILREGGNAAFICGDEEEIYDPAFELIRNARIQGEELIYAWSLITIKK